MPGAEGYKRCSCKLPNPGNGMLPDGNVGVAPCPVTGGVGGGRRSEIEARTPVFKRLQKSSGLHSYHLGRKAHSLYE